MQQTHYVAVLFVKEKKAHHQCVSHKKIHWHNYLFDICFQVHFGVDTHTLRLWMYNVLQLLILFSLELAQSHSDEEIFH